MSIEVSTPGERWVRVTVRLLHGRYDAGTDGGLSAEWPPEPYRLFAALRAGAAGLRLTSGQDAEDSAVAALRILETTPPPVICVSSATAETHSGFVPVIPDFRSSNPTAVDVGKASNRVKADAFPGITTSRGQRFYQSAIPAEPTIIFDLDATELSDRDVDWLRAAAGEISYFGRSTSPALITIGQPGPKQEPADKTRAYVPGAGSHHLAVWSLGLVDALEDKHRALQQDRPMTGRALTTYAAYGYVGESADTWLAFERDDTPYRAVIKARRDLVGIARSLGNGLDVVLIANVANKYANGRLALAASFSGEASGPAVTATLGSHGWLPAGTGAWLKKKTWVQESTVFATATPVWLDATTPDRAREEIRSVASRWGEVHDIAVSRTPFLKGATTIPDHRAWHAALEFEKPVPPQHLPHRLGQMDGVLLPLGATERARR